MADPKFPGIPALTGVAGPMRAVLGPMREILQSIVAGNLPQNGILNGLARVGFVDTDGNPTIPPNATGTVDATPPPAPTGLTAGGAIANIILSWDAVPAAAKARVAYTEIWRSETNSLASAALIGTSRGRVYTDNIGAAAQRYYWIRYVSPANIVPPITGPYNSQIGTLGKTGNDAGYLIDLLTANPPPGSNYSPLFYIQPTEITINGVIVPAGVYINDAMIRNLSVTNAMIANLAVDNAKIASLDAGKITTGYIDADRLDANVISSKVIYVDAAVIDRGYINTARIQDATITMAKIAGSIYSDNWFPSGGTQGWLINRDGTAAFQNGFFRGSVYATDGVFTGSVYATDGVFTGDVYATNLYGNVVDTGNVKFNAIAEFYTGEGETDAYVTVPRVSGSKVIVHATAKGTSTLDGSSITLTIRRNGVALSNGSANPVLDGYSATATIFALDNVETVGNVYYSIDVTTLGSNTGLSCLMAVEHHKR